jgi:hypothetical protein
MQSQNNQTYDYIHPVKVKGEVLPPISDKIITGWVISFLIAAFAPPVNINDGHIIQFKNKKSKKTNNGFADDTFIVYKIQMHQVLLFFPPPSNF